MVEQPGLVSVGPPAAWVIGGGGMTVWIRCGDPVLSAGGYLPGEWGGCQNAQREEGLFWAGCGWEGQAARASGGG